MNTDASMLACVAVVPAFALAAWARAQMQSANDEMQAFVVAGRARLPRSK